MLEWMKLCFLCIHTALNHSSDVLKYHYSYDAVSVVLFYHYILEKQNFIRIFLMIFACLVVGSNFETPERKVYYRWFLFFLSISYLRLESYWKIILITFNNILLITDSWSFLCVVSFSCFFSYLPHFFILQPLMCATLVFIQQTKLTLIMTKSQIS